MIRGYVKCLGKLFICLNGKKIFRQTGTHVIVNVYVIVAVERRNAQHDSQYAKHFIMLDNKAADVCDTRQERFMRSLGNQTIHHTDDTRQQRYRTQHAENNAFAHNNAEVTAKGEAHEADGNETGDSRQAAADD